MINDICLERDFLAHYGIQGQEWGVRRYQNPDGSLTPEGRRHYYGEAKRSLNTLKRETIQSGYNERMSMKEATSALKKMKTKQEKGTLTEKQRLKAEKKLSIATQMMLDYSQNEKKYKQMVSDLKNEYGDKKIKDIKYKEYKVGNSGNKKQYVEGSVIPTWKKACYTGMNLTTIGLTAVGVLPFGLLYMPSEKRARAWNYAKKYTEYSKAYDKNDDKVVRTYLPG